MPQHDTDGPAPRQSGDKTCSRCGCRKPRDQFHRRSRSADGLQSYCKDCDGAASVAQRKTPAGKSYIQKWRKTPAAQEGRRRYVSSDEGRQRHREAGRKHRRDSRAKAVAREAANKAIAAGLLIRPRACESCGATPPPQADGRASIQAHHDDHSKPLEVRWLCVDCHRQADKEASDASA